MENIASLRKVNIAHPYLPGNNLFHDDELLGREMRTARGRCLLYESSQYLAGMEPGYLFVTFFNALNSLVYNNTNNMPIRNTNWFANYWVVCAALLTNLATFCSVLSIIKLDQKKQLLFQLIIGTSRRQYQVLVFICQVNTPALGKMKTWFFLLV